MRRSLINHDQIASALLPIFDAMCDKGIKAKWLAKKLGMTQQGLNQIRYGVYRPPPGFALRCAELLQLDYSVVLAAKQVERPAIKPKKVRTA